MQNFLRFVFVFSLCFNSFAKAGAPSWSRQGKSRQSFRQEDNDRVIPSKRVRRKGWGGLRIASPALVAAGLTCAAAVGFGLRYYRSMKRDEKDNVAEEREEKGASTAAASASAAAVAAATITPHIPVVDILANLSTTCLSSDLQLIKNGNADVNPFEKKYIILVFDVESPLVQSSEKKARVDYFNLMSNLTSAATKEKNVATVYVPGESASSHLFEGNDDKDFKGKSSHWSYLSSSSRVDKQRMKALRKKFSIKDEELRIVVVHPDGQILSENALDLLRVNPRAMPWPPTPLMDILGSNYLEGSGRNNTITINPQEKKVIGLYFSASWCQPCKIFSPKLAEAYLKNFNGAASSSDAVDNATNQTSVEDGTLETKDENKIKENEIVFVSLDQSEEDFNKYRSTMPWPSIPFLDARRAILQIALKVTSIPALVFIDSNGKIITDSGVSELLTDPKLSSFPWRREVTDLTSSGATLESLQRGPALIALLEDCQADVKERIKAELSELATQVFDKKIMMPQSPRERISISTLETPGKVSDAIRKLCNLPVNTNTSSTAPTNKPIFLILDLTREEFASLDATEANVMASLTDFISSYSHYNVPMKPLVLPTMTTP